MFISRDYVHAFVALEDESELEYFTASNYSYEYTKSIRYGDLNIAVDWDRFWIKLKDDLSLEKTQLQNT